MPDNCVVISGADLHAFSMACFEKEGFSSRDARIIADNLLEADLRGLNTHGVLRVTMYLKRVRAGVLNSRAEPELLQETPAFAIWDAHNCMGQLACVKAMDMAIERAREAGLYMTGVRNSNHFGTAAYYTMRASRQRMIGFSCSNTEALMPAPGGAQKVVGNNPFSAAFPGGKYPDIVVDMAVSAAAIGKIVLSDKKGIEIPNGWATDVMGIETNDPKKALDGGFLLPVGGPKGYGLGLAVDILAGVLMGSGYGQHVRCPFHDFSGPQNLGHMFIVIDVEKFQPWDIYAQKVEDLVRHIKASKKAPGVKEIFLPGEMEYNKMAENKANGVTLPLDLIAELCDFAREIGLASEMNTLEKYLAPV